jgi:hypothetical protein
MVGTLERVALIVATASAIATAGDAYASDEHASGRVSLSLGLPFSTLRGEAEIADWILGVRADLVEDHALRVGAGAELVWQRTPLVLSTSIEGMRAIGFDAASSWDVELTQRVALDAFHPLLFGARGALIGYLGELPSQRGVVGLVSATVGLAVAEMWTLAVEAGWMADKHSGRWLASAMVARTF